MSPSKMPWALENQSVDLVLLSLQIYLVFGTLDVSVFLTTWLCQGLVFTFIFYLLPLNSSSGSQPISV